jgi:predicted AlkP superfamily phosphohydrolase/phosphomutase
MTTARRRRVLVIGLDGATFRTLDPWAAAGDMPELARLMETAATASCARPSLPSPRRPGRRS